jgi:hypothetical protein
MDNDSPTSGDAEIVEQVVAGDVHAFEHLLRKYQSKSCADNSKKACTI